ncbi:tetratricopeptide repeat protein [Mangrovibacterium sp.]|uniref:tetratricopeptide repeat protein n=1 Tax=Mangrovibacterium sp. TaxID=1961364 RepID=UPI003565E840
MYPRIKHLRLKLFRNFLTSSICLLFSINLIAQSDPEMIAKQNFSNGQFTKALPVFQDLVRLYPDDPELNYYLGACLIETGQFSSAAHQALEHADGTKKSNWYLAQYYHATNQWEKAMESYQEFKDNGSQEDIQDVSLEEMMELCSQEVNPYGLASDENETLSAPQIEMPEQITSIESTNLIESAPLPPSGPSYSDSLISFPVNAEITYWKVSQFKSAEARQNFIDARLLESTLKTQLQNSKQLREKYDEADDLEKARLAESILNLEQQTYNLSREITQKDQAAHETEANYWQAADLKEISEFKATVRHQKDSLANASKQAQVEAEQQAQLIIVEATDSLAMDSLQTESLPVDEITYRIQIGAYRDTPPEWAQRLFKKLSVLRRIDQYKDDNGVTVYTVGEIKNYEDAQQMLKQIKLEGVSNAIIAAYKNKERISLNEARKTAE